AESDLSRALDGRIDLPSLDLGDDDGFTTTGVRRAVSEAAADLGDFNVDIPSLETLRGPVDVEATAVDLSSIGLDLSPESLSGPGAGGDANRWQEMATKLDLASAYEEIGDKEGARELLEEVVRGGDSEQQQKARSMLSKIS
ncbi:MAG: FimV/HubP family polar landmark protein, partial [Burkholderiaceae bacterium]